MEHKFISINELKKVLYPKEMKNVLGGSGSCPYGTTWCVGPGENVIAGCTPDGSGCASLYGPGWKCECYGV